MTRRVVMFTMDEQIDRRILNEAEALEKAGFTVRIIAPPKKNITEHDTQWVCRLHTPTTLTAHHRSDVLLWCLAIYRRLRRFVHGGHIVLRWTRALAFRYFVAPEKAFVRLFQQAIDEEVADIYTAHDLPMVPVALAAQARHGGQVVFDSHEWYPEQDFSPWEAAMWRRLQERVISACQAIITVNPSIAEQLHQRHTLPIPHVVHNAEHPIPIPDPRPQYFHHHFNLPSHAKIVLLQGGLTKGRNLDTLIESFRYIPNPDIHLVLLGDGEFKPVLQARTQQWQLTHRVHFHAAVAQKNLLDYTLSAHLGVIPYTANCRNNHFATPNKLFEYLAAGLPIVASDLPELRRLVADTGAGRVGNTLHPRPLAALIVETIENDAILNNHRAQVLQLRQTIQWNNEAKTLIAVYQSLLS